MNTAEKRLDMPQLACGHSWARDRTRQEKYYRGQHK